MPKKPATPSAAAVARKPPAPAKPKAIKPAEPKTPTKTAGKAQAAPKASAKVVATAKPKTAPRAAKVKPAPAKTKKPAAKRVRAKPWPTDETGARIELDAEEEAAHLGRPSLYRDEYAMVAKIVCGIAGLDEEKLGAELGVTGRTVRNWMKKHPAFAEAVARGRDRADNEVVNALHKTATGFMMPAVDIRTVGVGKGESVVEITKYEKFVPGDTFAQQYWLNNRRPDQWRAKVEVAIEATVMDVATAEAKYWERMAKSKERHADMLTERDKHGLRGD